MSGVVGQLFRRSPLLAWVATAHAVLFLIFIAGVLLDPAQILGVSRWIKPAKFAISIAIFTATIGLFLGWVEESRRFVGVLAWTIAVSMCGEMVLIALQSVRGVQSHFNVATVLDGVIFNVMGAFIMLNTVAVAGALYLFWRRPMCVDGALRTGIRLGTLLLFLASLEGGLMVGRGSHSVGVHDGGPGLPFVNWSTGAGDLRVAHFFGMHALQILPLLGFFLARRGVRHASAWVTATAAVYLLMFALLVAQALAGRAVLGAGLGFSAEFISGSAAPRSPLRFPSPRRIPS